MKKIAILSLTILLCLNISAQISHDVTVFNETGEKFTLVLNGKKINDEPSENVFIEDVHYDFANTVITFEDSSIPTIKKKVMQIADVEHKAPCSVVYKIKTDKKGRRKLRFSSRSDKKIQPKETVIIKEGGGGNTEINLFKIGK